MGQNFCMDIKQSVHALLFIHAFATAIIECCSFNALRSETPAIPLHSREPVAFTINCLRDPLSSTCDQLADQKSQTPLKDQKVLNQS